MIETIALTLFWFSFWVAIDELFRKKREIFLLVLCGGVPAALLASRVPLPIGIGIALLLVICPLVTAWRRDRIYGQKLLKYSVPVIAFYVLLALFSLYSHHWKIW